MRSFLWLLGALVISLAACARTPSTELVSSTTAGPSSLEAFRASLSAEDQALLHAIRERGGLRAGITTRSVSVHGGIDQAVLGFNPRLFARVAAVLDLEYSLEEYPYIDYLGIGGQIPPRVRTDYAYTYQPDAFRALDLALVSLTPIPWRLKLVHYVPVLPNQLLVIVHRAQAQASLQELKSLEFLLPANTSYEEQYWDFIGDHQGAPAPVLTDTSADVLAMLNAGQGQAVLLDANEYFPFRDQYPDLVPAYGVSAIHYLGWVCNREEPGLASLLARTLAWVYERGDFHSAYYDAYRKEYADYLRLLGLGAGQQIHELAFTLEELDYINQLRRSGGELKVALFKTNESYRQEPDGRIVGFDYWMVHDLAALLGLEPRIRFVDNLSDYFSKDGRFDPAVIQDGSIRYRPDLFDEVQLYAAAFGVNEWRSRLVRFVHMLPAGLVIVGRDADRIHDFKDMAGKRIAVTQGGTQAQLARQLMDEHGFQAELVWYEQNEDLFAFLRSGQADIAIDGSVFIARGMQELTDLTVSPLKLSVVPVAWAVAPENQVFAGIVRKFVDLSLATRRFQQYWEEAFGVPFDFYLQLVE